MAGKHSGLERESYRKLIGNITFFKGKRLILAAAYELGAEIREVTDSEIKQKYLEKYGQRLEKQVRSSGKCGKVLRAFG